MLQFTLYIFLNIYSIVVSGSMSIRHEANGIPIWVAGGLMGLIHADGKIAIRIGNKQGQNNPNDIITGCFVHHLFWSFYITFYSLHLLGWGVCLLEMLLFLRRRSRDCELHHQPKQVLCFPSQSMILSHPKSIDPLVLEISRHHHHHHHHHLIIDHLAIQVKLQT